ncbi:MAG: hypothetical protein ACI81V_001156 [Lentimonas sp.]|jgi:hypothetical protein
MKITNKIRIFAIVILAFSTSSIQASEWKQLFDGETLEGWEAQGAVNWAVVDGAITAHLGEISLLTSKEKYLNYELSLEFKAAVNTNSGVFLNSEKKIKDEATDCYEVNIAPPTNSFPTGSIVKFLSIKGQGEYNEWRSYRLTVRDNTIRVVLDGKLLYDVMVQAPRPAGHIGLQKNRGAIAFRNIWIRELDSVAVLP